jgi:hypothetical protein
VPEAMVENAVLQKGPKGQQFEKFLSIEAGQYKFLPLRNGLLTGRVYVCLS